MRCRRHSSYQRLHYAELRILFEKHGVATVLATNGIILLVRVVDQATPLALHDHGVLFQLGGLAH